ncbi:MAG TPA: hypothetical protein VGC27_03145 [Rhizomicrobium sp.]
MTEPSEKVRKYPPVERPAPYSPTGSEPGYDGEPPEFAVRRDLVEAEGKRKHQESLQNINCSRIAYLYAKKRIEWRQFMAAERLWKDAYDMGRFPKASNVIVGNGASGGVMGPGDVQVNASRRYHEARSELEFARNWAIVELVVEEQVSVEKAAGRLRMHDQAAMMALKLALHTLANHYRFA